MKRETLTSPERVVYALSGHLPDRVPVVEFVIDSRVARALYPRASDTQEMMDFIGLDAVSAGPDWRREMVSANEWYDEWGVRYRAGEQVLAHPTWGPISNAQELAAYRAPDPDATWRLETLRGIVARYKGKRSIWFHHRAAFMWSAYLAGLERILEWMLLEPELVQQLFSLVLETNERIVRNAIRAGAEVIVLGDDYASNQAPLFSPNCFETFVRPCLAHMVDVIHQEGARVVKHTDGNIWSIIDGIVSTGIDGLNPLEPVAGMDLTRVKERYGGQVCLIGNIDCGQLLSNGTENEVKQAVRHALAIGMPGGRYMLCSSNSIHASVRSENYRVMVQTGLQEGWY